MKTRGRTSKAAQGVIAGNFAERPKPPYSLTKPQKTIWQEVVAGENPDFFNSGVLRQLLADYCRRRSVCDEITEVIDTFGGHWKEDPEEHQRFDLLLKMRDRELAGVVLLATKLRLTNQSRYLPHVAARAAKRAPQDEMPWQKSA